MQSKSLSHFKKLPEREIQRINRLQRDLFNRLYHMFDPPLPEGVPERLEKIVAAAGIIAGDTVLDVGTGTGVLIPTIQKYAPRHIYACDLSEAMLKQLKKQYPRVETILSDVRDLTLPDESIDVVFINACYANIVDKARAFTNLSRMIRTAGRMVISHPLGKSFIQTVKKTTPFLLDNFPDKAEAEALFKSYGFEIMKFVDQPKLYILVIAKGSL